MYLTRPTERRNASNNFPLHLCQQRHPSQKVERGCWRKAVHLSWQRLKELCQELPSHVITSTCLTLLVLQLVGGSKSLFSLWLYPIFCETTFFWQYYHHQALQCSLLQWQIPYEQNSFCHLYTHFYAFWVSTQWKLSGQLQTCHTMSFFHAFSKAVSLLLSNFPT